MDENNEERENKKEMHYNARHLLTTSFQNLTKNLFISNGPKHLGSPVRAGGTQIKDVIIELSRGLKESRVREINIALFHPFKTLSSPFSY